MIIQIITKKFKRPFFVMLVAAKVLAFFTTMALLQSVLKDLGDNYLTGNNP